MGKVRRLRQKYHASLAKEKEKKASPAQGITDIPQLVPRVQEGTACDQSSSGNIFAGLEIHLGEMKNMPVVNPLDSDSMSIGSLGQKSKLVTKMEKRKRRREELLKKIDAVQSGQKAEKERKQREKTAVIGDLHPLMNALPSLEELLSSSQRKGNGKISESARRTPKQKAAQKQFLADVQMFTSVHQDPHFTKDPFQAVALAVENRVLCEED